MAVSATGEYFKERPTYAKWWFESAMLLLAIGLGWGLWTLIHHYWFMNASMSHQFFTLAETWVSGGSKTALGVPIHPAVVAPTAAQSPPLYPFLLSLLIQGQQPTSLINPQNDWLALINLGLYLGSILLVFQFLNARLKKYYAYVVTFLYVLSPVTLSAAQSITPQLLSLVVGLTAINTIDPYFKDRGESTGKFKLALSLLGVLLLLYTHHAGIALLTAFVVMLWYKRSIKLAAVVLGAGLLLMLPGWILQTLQGSPATVTGASVSSILAGNIQAPPIRELANPFTHPAVFGNQLQFNLQFLLSQTTDILLGTLHTGPSAKPAASLLSIHPNMLNADFHYGSVDWVTWVTGALLLVGTFFGLYQFSGLVSGFLLVWFILNLLLPPSGGISFFPVYPLLLFALFNGIVWLGRGLGKIHLPVSKVLVPLVAGVIMINALSQYVQVLQQQSELSPQQAITQRFSQHFLVHQSR